MRPCVHVWSPVLMEEKRGIDKKNGPLLQKENNVMVTAKLRKDEYQELDGQKNGSVPSGPESE